MMSMRWRGPLARLAAVVVAACSEEHSGAPKDGAAQEEAAAEIEPDADEPDADAPDADEPDADEPDADEPAPHDSGGPLEASAPDDAAAMELDAAHDAQPEDAPVSDADAGDADALDADADLDGSSAVDAASDGASLADADAGEDVVVPDCNPSAGVLLVASGGSIVEVTLSGQQVRSLRVPPGGPTGDVDDELRDLVQDQCGAIFAYQGTFVPSVAMQRDAGWDYASLPGFSTVNNVSYGGIALHGAHVFATDMFTFNAEARGVVRFPAAGGGGQRFGNDDPTDLNVGLDGLLYVLIGDTLLKQLDPETLSPMRSIRLSAEVRGVAVDRDGRIYGASWDGNVYAFKPDGSRLTSLALGIGSLSDIDLNERGVLAVSARGGAIALTSVALAGWSSLPPLIAYTDKVFVAFTNSGQKAEAPPWTTLVDAGVQHR